MALTDYVIMPGEDYQAIVDKLKCFWNQYDSYETIKSGDIPTVINQVALTLFRKDVVGYRFPKHLFQYAGITEIPRGAFARCYITSVDLEGITKIGGYAFADNPYLQEVVIPDSVTEITRAFENCGALSSVTIGSGITKLTSPPFDGCVRLTSITIPDTVLELGDHALYMGAYNNKVTVTFLGTTPPTAYGTYTSSQGMHWYFDIETLEKIIVPAGCRDAYIADKRFSRYADYIEEATTA